MQKFVIITVLFTDLVNRLIEIDFWEIVINKA